MKRALKGIAYVITAPFVFVAALMLLVISAALSIFDNGADE